MMRDLGRGHMAHLVLVDVEAAELLVLPSPGDGDGARGQLPERSANHGCGELCGRGLLLRSGNPASVEEVDSFSRFDYWGNSLSTPKKSLVSLSTSQTKFREPCGRGLLLRSGNPASVEEVDSFSRFDYWGNSLLTPKKSLVSLSTLNFFIFDSSLSHFLSDIVSIV
jgi:hypothetical protein